MLVDTAGKTTPVSVFLASTVAPGTTAPAGSVTVPVMVPLPPWPNAKDAMTRNAASWIGLKTAPRRRNAFVISTYSPLP